MHFVRFRPISLGLLVAGVSSLAGCAAPPRPSTAMTPTAFEMSLSSSARAVAAQLALLNQAEGHTGPASRPRFVAPRPVVSGALATRAAFAWDGPVDGAVRAIGARLKWRTTIEGARPASPVDVSIDAHDQRWYTILHSLADQTGSNCTISVNAARHHLTVIYSHVAAGVDGARSR